MNRLASNFTDLDFNNFFRKSYASTLSYIVFSRPDSGVFSHGTLYSGYGTKDQTSFTYNNNSFGRSC